MLGLQNVIYLILSFLHCCTYIGLRNTVFPGCHAVIGIFGVPDNH